MIKECEFCKKNNRIFPSEWELEDLMKLRIERIDDNKTKLGIRNIKNNRFELRRCIKCGTFWESRPLYEETMHGGEPTERVKVTDDYVKEHYPEVRI